MSLFLLQTEKSPNALPNKSLFSEDTSTVFSLIDEHNWLHPDSKHKCMTSSLSRLSSLSLRTLKSCIPIGSIEFVESVAGLAHNLPQFSPLLIPQKVSANPEWVGRRVAVEEGIGKAGEVFERFGTDRLFMKSASRLKSDFTDIYRRTDHLPQTDDAIFFSECVDFTSEWRVFVFRSKMIDLRNYAGDSWILPDKETVLSMVSAIGMSIPAYTLDVGVAGGKTLMVEVHNFVSCGLYGARPPLSMFAAGYRHVLAATLPSSPLI